LNDSSRSFNGEFFHQLDDKCRVKLPTRLLNTLLDNFGRHCRMVQMPEKCLAIYPQQTWERGWSDYISKLGPQVPGTADARAITRIAGATSLEIGIAAQGRVTIADNFRRHIGVSEGDRVAVIGAEDRIEIWEAESWQRYLADQMGRYVEIADRTLGQINGRGRPGEE